MPYDLEDKLVVGITSRALFDLDAEDDLFQRDGLEAYRAHQRARESDPLSPGTGFPLVRALLSVNERSDERLVEVVIVSRNDADSGMRILNSVEESGLDIGRAAFTDGSDPWAYLHAFHCNLFLSAEHEDVEAAAREGVPAAVVSAPPNGLGPESPFSDELRVAFDGDAVLFDSSSEDVYQREGLAAFQEREAELVEHPLRPGPLEPFLRALQRIQERFGEADIPIRTALVTARGAPAHRRVINTLRAWGVRIDESFFLGGVSKAAVLETFRPHIFFDDQLVHLESASSHTPSAQVLSADPQQLALFGQPAEPVGSGDAEAEGADEGAEQAPETPEPPPLEGAEQPTLREVS